MADETPPKASRRQEQIDKRRQQVEEARLAYQQAQARLRDAKARDEEKARKEETQLYIELGALMIRHWRDNPGTEEAALMFRLANRNVRVFRRHLFAEFGIDPVPPKGSNAERDMLEREARKQRKAANDPQKRSDDDGLKSQFPG